MILPPSHLTTWRVVDYAFGQHKLKYQVKMEAGGWEVIKKYVSLGMGISIVTSICLSGDEKLKAFRCPAIFPSRTYGLVIRKGKFLSPAAQRFVDLMREATKGKRPVASHRRRQSAIWLLRADRRAGGRQTTGERSRG